MLKRVLRLTLSIAVLTLMGAPANATYPERTISLIVPFAPGGGTDLTARTFSPYLEKYLGGTKVIIVNRPGAGGQVGATEIAHVAPDGYTVGLLTVPYMLTHPFERETRYTVDSFEPLGNMVFDYSVLATTPDSPFKSLKDVVEYAKAHPSQLTVASAGIGSNTHIDLMMFEQAAGIKLVHVPFGGGGASRNALLGKHVDLCASAIGDMQRFAEEGKVTVLGIHKKTCLETAPNIPTFAEQGFPLFNGAARGLIGPKGMPKEAVDVLSEATFKACRDPEFVKKSAGMSLPLDCMKHDDYAAYLQKAYKDLGDLWKTSPWTKE
ncbi:tripartite tricarboxylate transporter substrate binding protein [Shumkonia mesophila]|uniref:tripartite tricarboxylate transporter substrate binding protein n=1 Tax=Shumkonia mesophila TaxID=2838854 RepID=UPI002934193E|nr:tripartite tricarboxylate transporter substrate binding protein [Shumkonia mesophila]